jgi:hypothetical protein
LLEKESKEASTSPHSHSTFGYYGTNMELVMAPRISFIGQGYGVNESSQGGVLPAAAYKSIIPNPKLNNLPHLQPASL